MTFAQKTAIWTIDRSNFGNFRRKPERGIKKGRSGRCLSSTGSFWKNVKYVTTLVIFRDRLINPNYTEVFHY